MGREYRHSLVLVSTTVLVMSCGDSPPTPAAPRISEPTQVRSVEIKGVTITPSTMTLKVGDNQLFSVMLELVGDAAPVGALPRWTSTDSSIISVTPQVDGIGVGSAVYVSAVRPGQATLEVFVGTYGATRQIRVVP